MWPSNLFNNACNKNSNVNSNLAAICEQLGNLRQQIDEKEKELDHIKRIGFMRAEASRDYVEDLRRSHLSLQRTFNSILEKNPLIYAFAKKIVIDTFEDLRLNIKSDYLMLETIEIDIEKRVFETSGSLSQTVKVAENDRYQIFSTSSSYIRRDINTKKTVYFGKSHSKNGCILGQWFYCGSDSIWRIHIEKGIVEELDWLSHEKVLIQIGAAEHGHVRWVQEDRVERFSCLKNLLTNCSQNQITIYVKRVYKEKPYTITATEDNGQLIPIFNYPWEHGSADTDE